LVIHSAISLLMTGSPFHIIYSQGACLMQYESFCLYL
jgi:hypothetical protein